MEQPQLVGRARERPVFNKRIRLYDTMLKAGELEVELRQAEFVFAEPIRRYIDEITAQPEEFEEWPDVTQYPAGALPLLQLRVDTLLSWTWHHQAKRNLLSFPTIPFPNVALWLLVDWWQARGRRLGAARKPHDAALVGDAGRLANGATSGIPRLSIAV